MVQGVTMTAYICAKLQVLSDGHPREELPLLWHKGEAAADDLVGGKPEDVLPRRRIRPVGEELSPKMVETRVLFPAPFEPIRVTTSPLETCRETSHNTWRCEYDTFRFSMASKGFYSVQK